MNELKTLVQIVSDRSRKNLPILDIKSETVDNNKELELFRVIEDLESASDKEAAKVMYNTDVDDPRYKMLKHRLKNRLLNHLFFIDFKDPSVNISFQFEQECINYIYFSKTLLKNGHPDFAEKLATRALNLAKESEFTDLAIESLEVLRSIYSEKTKLNDYKDVIKELKQLRKIRDLEQEGEDLYRGIKLRLVKSINSRKKALKEAGKIINKLEELHKQVKSFVLFDRHYRLQMLYWELIGDFGSIIAKAGEIEKLYDKNKINVMRFDLRYNKFMKIYALLRSKKYDEGLKFAEKYLQDFDKTSVNYFSFLEVYFFLAMHSGKYDLAYDLIKQATRSPYFYKVSEFADDRWNLYKAYIFLVKNDRRIQRTFDYDKYYKNIPKYHKDRKGYNIAVVVLQFLYYLREENDAALKPLANELKKYAKLHLYQPTSQRSRIFVKLLILTYNNLKDPDILRIKSKVSLNKLKKLSPPGDIHTELEVIPYEKLWGFVLENVQKRQVESLYY